MWLHSFYSRFLINNWCSLYSHPQRAGIWEHASDSHLEKPRPVADAQGSNRQPGAARCAACESWLPCWPFALLICQAVKMEMSLEPVANRVIFLHWDRRGQKSDSADESFCVRRVFGWNPIALIRKSILVQMTQFLTISSLEYNNFRINI